MSKKILTKEQEWYMGRVSIALTRLGKLNQRAGDILLHILERTERGGNIAKIGVPSVIKKETGISHITVRTTISLLVEIGAIKTSKADTRDAFQTVEIFYDFKENN